VEVVSASWRSRRSRSGCDPDPVGDDEVDDDGEGEEDWIAAGHEVGVGTLTVWRAGGTGGGRWLGGFGLATPRVPGDVTAESS
jgi:hypothetical protein